MSQSSFSSIASTPRLEYARNSELHPGSVLVRNLTDVPPIGHALSLTSRGYFSLSSSALSSTPHHTQFRGLTTILTTSGTIPVYPLRRGASILGTPTRILGAFHLVSRIVGLDSDRVAQKSLVCSTNIFPVSHSRASCSFGRPPELTCEGMAFFPNHVVVVLCATWINCLRLCPLSPKAQWTEGEIRLQRQYITT